VSARSRATQRRFKKRAWARRWAVLRRILLVVVLLSLVGGAGWLVFVSPVLAVERVRVTGVRTVTPEQIMGAAAVPVGRPLARVDVDRIRARVEQVPVVARADISRSWPNTVAIGVTERTPVAAVHTGAGYRLIDAEGVTFRSVPGPRKLPVIEAGSHPQAGKEAAAVVAALPVELEQKVAQVQAATMDSITLQLRDGREVVWGSAEGSALKAKVLAALLERKAAVYDVSVPGSPTLQVG
jgi:cell division protein FtsQ